MNLTLGMHDAGELQLALNRKMTPFPDSFGYGPVRPFSVNSIERWVLQRCSYWNRIQPNVKVDWRREQTTYLRTIDAILDSKSITYWSACNVEGLILLAWLTFLIHARELDCPIEFVQYHRRGGPRLGGMRRTILANPPRPVPVVGQTAEFLISFWLAWTSKTPRPLLELYANANSKHSRRFLLSLILDRYPNPETGLSSLDHTLLRNVQAHGPRLPIVLSNTIADVYPVHDGVGTGVLRSRLIRMSYSGRPGALVTYHRNDNDSRREEVTLTRFGAKVLAGEASALEYPLPTDWIGGVRLAASNPVIWVRTPKGLAERRTITA